MADGPRKLVLCVIDAMASEMLERAIEAGTAPVLARLVRDGRYISDCVSAFPSVTPVCAASIVTGVAQDEHRIPGMNWYMREESRYVEYGSSFRAAQRFGFAQQLTDTIYNMNGAHLASGVPTVFETLDDAGVRTAGTTYLMYRGRFLHEPQRDNALSRVAATMLRHPVMGPRELFYADVFSSRRTGCRSGLGMPGLRDRHSACVSSYLVENDLFDFLLLSLPDNDWLSHKRGPEGQLQSLAQADLHLARVMNAAGGVDAFLARHAVVVMADHSQAPVGSKVSLQEVLAPLGVRGPGRSRAGEEQLGARIAVCPSQRAAMVYALEPSGRDAMRASVAGRALATDGVDLVMWLERDADDGPREGVIASAERGELRFSPGGPTRDGRGAQWSLSGALAAIEARVSDGVVDSASYPDALARCWAAISAPSSGDVLISAAPGWEFTDWGGQAHVGGGSHGSLHASDSLAPLILHGTAAAREPAQWAIRDVAALVREHFGA
ncbi:MAG TPA: alkaline phosphatase family protein [Solirubrobacteraceae bacterium]|nr:alkaline phosphatase family protein [Solirubrobacteraceae bacterium]